MSPHSRRGICDLTEMEWGGGVEAPSSQEHDRTGPITIAITPSSSSQYIYENDCGGEVMATDVLGVQVH